MTSRIGIAEIIAEFRHEKQEAGFPQSVVLAPLDETTDRT